MLFENIAVLNRDFTISEHQYVAVRDTHIAYVGALSAGGFRRKL